MGLPNVTISVLNNQLGATAGTNDGIVGMLLSAIDDGNVPMATAKQIFSLAEAEDLGIDAAYDTDNSVTAYAEIAAFYAQAGTGKELWFMLVPQAKTLEEMFTDANYATKLVDDSNKTIRVLAAARVPASGETPTITDGFPEDLWNALADADTFAANELAKMNPLRIVLGGYLWDGTPTNLADLTELTNNRIGIAITGDEDGNVSIGPLMGRIANIPVQRNIGRVKDGAILLTNAYLTDGTSIDDLSEAQIASIHNKGYILYRKYVNKAGYFFADDPMATADTDDYKSLARGRVIDKMILLTYSTYVEELLDEVPINTDGTLELSYVKYIQNLITNVLNHEMVAEGELSSSSCYIDPSQNILATNKLEIAVRGIPVGYSKELDITLGFENPQNA